MVERLHFNKERLEAIRSIGHEALDDVVKLYGAGYPTWEGTMKYTYHNRHHSYMTGIQAGAIAAEAGQGESVRALTEGIGFSHDRVYTGNRGQDERESAEWLKERLLLRGISRPAAEIASLAIIGTEPIFDKFGNLIDQRVNRMSFPSRQAEFIAKSVSSGDMGELPSPYSPFFSHNLYLEINDIPMGLVPPMGKSFIAFEERQINLIRNYKYPLGRIAERVVDQSNLRPRVLAYHEYLYGQLVGGKIETWDQVIAKDLRFAVSPESHSW